MHSQPDQRGLNDCRRLPVMHLSMMGWTKAGYVPQIVCTTVSKRLYVVNFAIR